MFKNRSVLPELRKKHSGDGRNDFPFLYCVLLVALFFGGIFYINFATDTYAVFSCVSASGTDMIIRNGRIVIGLLYKLWALLHISNQAFYYISYCLALVCMLLSVWLISRLLCRYIEDELLATTVAFVTVANVLVVEYFTFIEKIGFMLAILFVCLAAYRFERFARRGDRFSYVLAILFTVFAAFTYQGVVALFVVLTLPLVLRYADTIRQYLTKLVLIGVVYVAALGTSFLTMTIIGSSRAAETQLNLVSGISSMLHSFFVTLMRDGMNLLPRYFFGLMILFALCLNVWGILKQSSGEKRLLQWLQLTVILAGIPLASMVTIVFGIGWEAPRVIYPVGALLGALLTNYFLNNTDAAEKAPTICLLCKKLVCAAMTLCLVFQFLAFTKVYVAKYQNDALDQYQVKMIVNLIDDYERENHLTVENISVYRDAYKSYVAYPVIYSNGDMVISSFATSWSDLTAINYYSGKQYKRAENDAAIAEQFRCCDWDTFNEDQLIFDGNTLHLCVY